VPVVERCECPSPIFRVRRGRGGWRGPLLAGVVRVVAGIVG
jgi:hypothetical protein